MPMTGTPVRQMNKFDQEFSKFLQRWSIPGASVTVSYKGKIIFSRAYGYANKETKELVQPGTRFRVASLSKSITAVGVLLLCQQGKLNLEDKAFVLLKELKPCGNASVDPRLYQISIRDLLQCTAGWGAGKSNIVMGGSLQEIISQCTHSMRPSLTAVVRYLIGQPLDADPGQDYCYSNVSYCVLGKIVEKVTGKTYDNYITEAILKPCGLNSIVMGNTVRSVENEVIYYPFQSETYSLLPNVKSPASASYGGAFVLEAGTSSFGWIASTPDLVRFISILCNETKISSPLNKYMFELMLARPQIDDWRGVQEYFALGWEVERSKDGKLLAFSRHGSLEGTMALVEHQANGLSWAAAFNSRPTAYEGSREEGKAIIKEALKGLLPSLQKSEH